MTEPTTNDSNHDSENIETESVPAETPVTKMDTDEISLGEIITDMPGTLGEDGVKQAILKLGITFAVVAVGFLFIVLAFGASLMRMESGEGMEALADFQLFIQLALAMFGAILIALLNPVLLAGVIGFETANKIDDIKPAVTTATVGCAIGAILLVLILVVGSAVGFAVLVPDSAQDVGETDDQTTTSESPYTSSESQSSEQQSEEEGGLGATNGILLLLFSGLVGGIAGGGGAYATKKYGGEALAE